MRPLYPSQEILQAAVIHARARAVSDLLPPPYSNLTRLSTGCASPGVLGRSAGEGVRALGLLRAAPGSLPERSGRLPPAGRGRSRTGRFNRSSIKVTEAAFLKRDTAYPALAESNGTPPLHIKGESEASLCATKATQKNQTQNQPTKTKQNKKTAKHPHPTPPPQQTKTTQQNRGGGRETE